MPNLNLLNPIEIKKIEKIRLYFLIKHFLIQIISILLIISTIFIFSLMILQSNSISLEEQIEKELSLRQEGNVNSIEESTKKLNAQLAQVDQIQNKYIKWTSFLNDFSNLVPPGIKLDNVEFETNIIISASQMTFTINGEAKSRENLISFQNNLEKSSYFVNIKTPISNLIQKENINFTITGNLTNEIKN